MKTVCKERDTGGVDKWVFSGEPTRFPVQLRIPGREGMVPVTTHGGDRDQKGDQRTEEWLEGGGERN